MSSDESSRASSPAPVEKKKTKSAKRKANVEEIEVDLTAPEPPSKKAKRALKKGKKVPESSSSSSKKKSRKRDNDDDLMDSDADEAAKDGEAAGKGKEGKPARSEHGVWIGNLPFTLTAGELREWLVSNSGGVITAESITRMKLPTQKEPGREKGTRAPNRGFAYVDVVDLSTKVAAIALSETELGGRKLLIKDSKSFEGRPKKEEPEPAVDGAEGGAADDGTEGSLRLKLLKDQKQAFARDADAPRKIFVGNMSFQTTEDDVRRNFEKCGEIEFIKVATFEDSGKCKGFGWVRFKDPDAAAWAVKGFVKIKEAIETEEDFADENSDDDDEEEEDEDNAEPKKSEKKKGPAQQQKQFKTRKWWVNRILGRTLKIELAEDDHVRYKKRFGKDANRDDAKKDNRGPRPPRDNKRQPRDDRSSKPAGDKKPVEELKQSDDIQVARLTGAVVKSTGTKVTFD